MTTLTDEGLLERLRTSPLGRQLDAEVAEERRRAPLLAELERIRQEMEEIEASRPAEQEFYREKDAEYQQAKRARQGAQEAINSLNDRRNQLQSKRTVVWNKLQAPAPRPVDSGALRSGDVVDPYRQIRAEFADTVARLPRI